MICPDALTCSIRNGGCHHAKYHEIKGDCLIEFDKCPKCIDGVPAALEIFLTEKDMEL